LLKHHEDVQFRTRDKSEDLFAIKSKTKTRI